MADETFESADSGASMTVPVQAGNLKKGDFVCINGFPCKVVDISTSKTGKHGHAKANITALDVFTGKKYEEVATGMKAAYEEGKEVTVTVMAAMGKECVMTYKVAQS
jgi:translation elongation factor P/translation initiation factor 5A